MEVVNNILISLGLKERPPPPTFCEQIFAACGDIGAFVKDHVEVLLVVTAVICILITTFGFTTLASRATSRVSDASKHNTAGLVGGHGAHCASGCGHSEAQATPKASKARKRRKPKNTLN